MFENFLSNCTWWLLPLLLLAFLLGCLFWHFLKVSKLWDRINGLESTNSNLNGRVSGLEGDLSTKATAYASLQGNYDGLSTRYTGLESNLLAEQKSKADLEAELSDWRNKFASMEGNYTTLQGKYETDLAAEKAAKLKFESSLGALQTQFGDLEGNYKLASGNATKWEADFKGLQDRYISAKRLHETQSNELNVKLTNLQNEAALTKEAHATEISNWNNKLSDFQSQAAAEKDEAIKAENSSWSLKWASFLTEKEDETNQWNLKFANLQQEKEEAVKAEANNWNMKFGSYKQEIEDEKAKSVEADSNAWNLKFQAYQQEAANEKEEAVKAEANKWSLKWNNFAKESEAAKEAAVQAETDRWNLKWSKFSGEVAAEKAAAVKEEDNRWNLKWNSLEADYRTKLSGLETDNSNWKSKYATLEASIDQRCLDASKEFMAKRVKKDDLTVVEGIGPKIQELLHNAGIKTWFQLWKSDYDTLKQVLVNGGSRFQMHDPKTWSEQARLAHFCQWAKLKQWQDELDGGKGASAELSEEKKKEILKGAKQYYARIKWDDLKVVEGIGPKIEQLCHNIGIKTWKALSEAKYETLKKMLTDGGSRYQMHDPTTWPLQSGMAYKNEWKKLKEWQDSHSHGRA